MNLPEFNIHDRTAHVELMYPRIDGNVDTVTVGLCDVRAADDLTIRYDFDRDGWAITREVTRDVGFMMERSGRWVEVAFVPAWTESDDTAQITAI